MGTPATSLGPKTPAEYAVLADEWAACKARVDLAKPDQARLKEIEGLFEPLFDQYPPDQPVVVEGYEFQLQVSPRENKTIIDDIAEVRRSMSAAAFLGIATVTLTKLKTAVSESRYLQLVSTARTGPRSIKAVWLGKITD